MAEKPHATALAARAVHRAEALLERRRAELDNAIITDLCNGDSPADIAARAGVNTAYVRRLARQANLVNPG